MENIKKRCFSLQFYSIESRDILWTRYLCLISDFTFLWTDIKLSSTSLFLVVLSIYIFQWIFVYNHVYFHVCIYIVKEMFWHLCQRILLLIFIQDYPSTHISSDVKYTVSVVFGPLSLTSIYSYEKLWLFEFH